MKTGVVKWFDEKKGYGFINSPGVEGDIFVHHKEIQEKGFRTLRENQAVEFELFNDPKGLRAKNVKAVS